MGDRDGGLFRKPIGIRDAFDTGFDALAGGGPAPGR